MPWIRSGHCCRCGDCCRGDPLAGNDELRSEAMRRPPPAAGYCPLFEFHNGMGHCSGHGLDPYYLAGCNVWPEHPDTIKNYPRCTYTFEWVGG